MGELERSQHRFAKTVLPGPQVSAESNAPNISVGRGTIVTDSGTGQVTLHLDGNTTVAVTADRLTSVYSGNMSAGTVVEVLIIGTRLLVFGIIGA